MNKSHALVYLAALTVFGAVAGPIPVLPLVVSSAPSLPQKPKNVGPIPSGGSVLGAPPQSNPGALPPGAIQVNPSSPPININPNALPQNPSGGGQSGPQVNPGALPTGAIQVNPSSPPININPNALQQNPSGGGSSSLPKVPSQATKALANSGIFSDGKVIGVTMQASKVPYGSGADSVFYSLTGEGNCWAKSSDGKPAPLAYTLRKPSGKTVDGDVFIQDPYEHSFPYGNQRLTGLPPDTFNEEGEYTLLVKGVVRNGKACSGQVSTPIRVEKINKFDGEVKSIQLAPGDQMAGPGKIYSGAILFNVEHTGNCGLLPRAGASSVANGEKDSSSIVIRDESIPSGGFLALPPGEPTGYGVRSTPGKYHLTAEGTLRPGYHPCTGQVKLDYEVVANLQKVTPVHTERHYGQPLEFEIQGGRAESCLSSGSGYGFQVLVQNKWYKVENIVGTAFPLKVIIDPDHPAYPQSPRTSGSAGFAIGKKDIHKFTFAGNLFYCTGQASTSVTMKPATTTINLNGKNLVDSVFLKSVEQVGDFTPAKGGKVLLSTVAASEEKVCKLQVSIDGTPLGYTLTVPFQAGQKSKELQIGSIQQYLQPNQEHVLAISPDPSDTRCVNTVKTALKLVKPTLPGGVTVTGKITGIEQKNQYPWFFGEKAVYTFLGVGACATNTQPPVTGMTMEVTFPGGLKRTVSIYQSENGSQNLPMQSYMATGKDSWGNEVGVYKMKLVGKDSGPVKCSGQATANVEVKANLQKAYAKKNPFKYGEPLEIVLEGGGVEASYPTGCFANGVEVSANGKTQTLGGTGSATITPTASWYSGFPATVVIQPQSPLYPKEMPGLLSQATFTFTGKADRCVGVVSTAVNLLK